MSVTRSTEARRSDVADRLAASAGYRPDRYGPRADHHPDRREGTQCAAHRRRAGADRPVSGHARAGRALRAWSTALRSVALLAVIAAGWGAGLTVLAAGWGRWW